MPPIRLFAANPHYLEYQGRPTLLLSSAEHYGALLNGAFDYATYLRALQRDGMNLTRVFSGTYRELPGDFGIVDNTLAPEGEDYIAPWAHAMVEGRRRYDLTQWNPAYFARLHDLMRVARECGVIVEYVFFCFWYGAHMWEASPLHPRNNVNGTEEVGHHDVYRVEHARLMAAQTAFVRKVATELNGYDNLYYEICNEPYSRQDDTWDEAWSNTITVMIADTEAALPNRHLIAVNMHNRRMVVPPPHPAVGIINFHYAVPEAVAYNYHLPCVIADDETGCFGHEYLPYRREMWQFIMAGGGVFNHLDYSFTVRYPGGDADALGTTPGCGGPAWRHQVRVLRDFLAPLNLATVAPHPEIGLFTITHTVQFHVLAELGQAYAIYITGGGPSEMLKFNLQRGAYTIEWISPSTGHLFRAERIEHAGGPREFHTPAYGEDIALRILRQD